MSRVSVSRGALHKVKIAFGEFHLSVEDSTNHMKSHAEDVITSTRASIKMQQALVETLKNKAKGLATDIEQCQAQIISNNNQLSSLKGEITNAVSRVNSLAKQIALHRAHKQCLMSHNTSSSDDGNDNSGQIEAVENLIQNCERQLRQQNDQIASMRDQEGSLKAQNTRLHNDKTRLDSELATAKKELTRAREKSEKMKSAGAAVESSVNNLLNVARQFRETAITTSNTSKSGIENCLAAIDAYETVNLAATNSSADRIFSSYEQRFNETPKDTARWESGVRGEGLCTTTSSEANDVLAAYGRRGVVYLDAIPDFSPFAVYTVEVGHMPSNRENENTEFGGTIGSYKRADIELAKQLGWSICEVSAFRCNHIPKLTWHECNDMLTMQLIPTVINNSFGHYGGIAEAAALRREAHSIEEFEGAFDDSIPNAMDYSENQDAYDLAMEETPPVSRGPVDLRF